MYFLSPAPIVRYQVGTANHSPLYGNASAEGDDTLATATQTTVESGDDAFPETHNEVFHRQERSFFPALLQVRPGLPRAKFEDTLDVGEDVGQTQDPAAQDRELVPRTGPASGVCADSSNTIWVRARSGSSQRRGALA